MIRDKYASESKYFFTIAFRLFCSDMLPTDVTNLLPQKHPFKMVDTLHFADGSKIVTSFRILAENVLVNGDQLSEGGMIENMAQSAAAGTGYFFAAQNKDIPIGYIGAIKQVKIFRRPVCGEEISTTLVILNNIGQASIVSAEIFSGKEQLGSCELTIFVQPS